jgi:hypothetical protein
VRFGAVVQEPYFNPGWRSLPCGRLAMMPMVLVIG